MLSNPAIRSIGSEPGNEDFSSPALRVPDGDRLPGELAHLLKVRRTVLIPLCCGVLREVP